MSRSYAPALPINVAIASYDPFIANGLANSLQTKEEFAIRGTLATEEIFEHVLLKQGVNVLLMHPQQVDASLHEALHTLGTVYPHTKKILLLPHENLQHYLQAINMNVQGVLIYPTMTLGNLLCAIHEVHEGKQFLAPLIVPDIMHNLHLINSLHPFSVPRHNTLTIREKELLAYLVEGLSNREIAKKLQVEMKTVKNHLTHIYSKLQVKNRLEAVVVYYRSSPAKDARSVQCSQLHERFEA
jgi:two-component system, NarL family, nitrate/nitrite response regulator NarL